MQIGKRPRPGFWQLKDRNRFRGRAPKSVERSIELLRTFLITQAGLGHDAEAPEGVNAISETWRLCARISVIRTVGPIHWKRSSLAASSHWIVE